MQNRTLCIQFRTKFGVKLNTKHTILHQIWCEIENKAYNFASNIGVELDLLELLYFQFRTKFDAKLYALYSISLQI